MTVTISYDKFKNKFPVMTSEMQEKIVEKATHKALPVSVVGRDLLMRLNAGTPNIFDKKIYKACFGKISDKRLKSVFDRVDLIHTWLNGWGHRSIEYVADYEKNKDKKTTIAYVKEGQNPRNNNTSTPDLSATKRIIHICFPRFFLSDTDMQAETILHELAHAVQNTWPSVSFIHDNPTAPVTIRAGWFKYTVPSTQKIYGMDAVSEIAKADPNQAVLIADSYAMFFDLANALAHINIR